jgi:hypothetical protein
VIETENKSARLSSTESSLSKQFILSLRIGDEWEKKANWTELRNFIQKLRSLVRIFPSTPEIEWPILAQFLEDSEMEVSPAFNELDDETLSFIERLSLWDGISWLQVAIPKFFFGADFEIEILPAEEEEDILGVRVYGSLSTSVFRERRHALCKAMKEAGHRRLYEVISIFQRRTRGYGWQAVSWYSALSAE